MRIIIYGPDGFFALSAELDKAIDKITEVQEPKTILYAKGNTSFSESIEKWAARTKRRTMPFIADWNTWGNYADKVRMAEMVKFTDMAILIVPTDSVHGISKVIDIRTLLKSIGKQVICIGV